MYNVVLIGCGKMGAAHLDDIYLREDICIYGVVDSIEERARYFAKKYHAKSFDVDYMRYMKDPLVDIIICATYPSTHLQILNACVFHHKHLLCEKPIAGNEEDGLKFIETAKKADIKIQIGFILRYNETYKTIAKMIRDGVIGFPIMFRMTQNHHAIDWQRYLVLINQASPIIDCGVHYIDVCRWFTGADFVEISGISLVTEPDVPNGKYNYGMVAFKLSDGSAGYYEAGWGRTVGADNTKEFIGPKGRIKLVQQENRFENREEGDLIELYNFPDQNYKTINIACKRKPTGDELSHLINMIENNVAANPSIEDVEESFKISILADKMARENKGGSTMLNFALIGVGGLGKIHLANLLELEQIRGDIRLVALCDVEATRIYEKVETNLGEVSDSVDLSKFKFYQDAYKMFENEKLDFIVSALPTYLHEKIAVTALELGIHVFSEKPMALTPQGCQNMISKSEEKNRILMIGHCLRYAPEYLKLKEYVDSGKYGKVQRAEFFRYSATPAWTWQNWMLDYDKSGGAALDMHIMVLSQ